MIERRTLVAWVATLVFGVGGGWSCTLLHVPLPWMIGPLLVTAGGRLLELPLRVPPGTRNAGQWVIGLALGLYFTPQVAAQLGELLPAILAGALAALAAGATGGHLLRQLSRQDPATAYFAAMPGGASEMANLAEQHGARIDLVAAAHGLRVMIVVILIPSVYVLLDLHGSDQYQQAAQTVHWPGLGALALLGAVGAVVWRRLRQPNAWIIGPLLITAIVTASGNAWSALPSPISAAGQLFIGCSLGTSFSRRFLTDAPRFLLGSLAITGFLLLVMAAFGGLLAWAANLWTPSVILGLAPGGIAEMCITAKVLQLGVPVVTAFHVVRSIAVVTLCGPLFRWLQTRGTAR